MNLYFLVLCTMSLNFGDGLQIYFNLHVTEGPFPKIIQIIISCTEKLEKKPSQNATIENITLPDNQERLKKPISFSYGKFRISDIKVNSTERYKCSIVTPIPRIYHDEVKTRLTRELKASIPAEFGQCRPGYSLASYDRCFPCHPGTYGSGASSRCLPCPKNYYAPLAAQDSCYACPKGSVSTKEGADNEYECIYVDDQGKPLPRISTKALVIIICVSIFVVLVIIAILVWSYVWKRFRTKKNEKKKLPRPRPEIIRVDQSPLFMRDSGPFYRQASNSDEHIYAEIQDFDYDSDDYLDPIKLKKEPTYIEVVDTDSHIYEEPISFRHVAISEGSVHCTKPELQRAAYTEVITKKQKEDNRFAHNSERPNANNVSKNANEDRKVKLKNENHMVENETKKHRQDLQKIRRPRDTGNTKLKQHQVSSENAKLCQDIQKVVESLSAHDPKRSSDGVKKQSSKESEIREKKLTYLLRKILKESKYCGNLKETLIGPEESQRVSNTNASDESLIEMSMEQSETQDGQQTIPDLIKEKNEGKDRSRDSISETGIDISDSLHLPEINDSNTFLGNPKKENSPK